MKQYFFSRTIILLGIMVVASLPTVATAGILGQHAFTWWDDPQAPGVVVTPLGSPPPNPAAVQLFDFEEWHLDQAQTTQWYAGAPVGGLPVNPFNPGNRTGVTFGSAFPAVAGAEGFIYRLTNVNYGSGNGLPAGPPFTFTDPVPPGPGVNDISGINIIDTHGALGVSTPFPGSQFMFTTIQASAILDTTPGSLIAPQDWDFNAFSPGSFEWDLSPGAGAGVVSGFPPAVFGFAMPGNWRDAVNNGWVHSWNPNLPAGPALQVNITAPIVFGFSGPQPLPSTTPEPSTFTLAILGLLTLGMTGRRRRSR
jgi:uncharacterized protein (TIGR03382 family)